MAQIPTTQEAASAQWSAEEIQVDDADRSIQLAAADPGRRSVVVVNDTSSAGMLWLTPMSGVRRGGMRVRPGSGVTLGTGAAVYGYATGGDARVNVVTESGSVCA